MPCPSMSCSRHAERFALDVHEPHLAEPALVHATYIEADRDGRERGRCPGNMARADNGGKGEEFPQIKLLALVSNISINGLIRGTKT
jgi:hypothetical protein